MVEIREIEKGIYSFPIVLPDNPLKWINCYVLKGEPGTRNLLIDSGFHREECSRALFEGIGALGLRPEDTDVFFTHLHSDHTGNGYELASRGYRIRMSELDHRILLRTSREDMAFRGRRLGIPEELLGEIITRNPGLNYASRPFEADYVGDGALLCYGGRTLRCLHMPGHTPGLMCLYDAEDRVLFSSDHVLFDITPNIVSWMGFPDSLGAYLESLEKIRACEVRLCLPAHRTDGGKTLCARADEIAAHHARRLEETLETVRARPGQSAYAIAPSVKWRIRARNWDDFPAGQKWFAVGEVLAHLERLEATGQVRREADRRGVFLWHAC